MMHNHLRNIFITSFLALVMTGCAGQGDKDRTESAIGSDKQTAPKKQAAAKNKDTRNQIGAYELDGNLSPEASIRRDLERLMLTEKDQENRVREMKNALAQNSEIIRKEEDRLIELRRQIEQFESAQRLYQQAAAGHGTRTGNGGIAGLASGNAMRYRTVPAMNTADNNDPAPHDRLYRNGQLGRDDPDSRQLSYNDNAQVQHGSYPDLQPAPRPPAHASQRRALDEDIVWDPPGHLFPQSPDRGAPGQTQPSAESFSPPKQTRSAAPEAQEQSADNNTGTTAVNDDIFIPDLFLSSAK